MRVAAEPGRRWLLQAGGAALLAGCGQGAALDRLAQGPRGRVARVLTGDKLVLEGGREVLLAGVEAPAPGAPYGEPARAALERLVRGREVELLNAGAEGAASAQPAHLRVGRAWVQGALLDAGAVWVRTASDDRALAPEMLAREAGARGARRGLWGVAAYGVRLPDEIEPGERGFRIVEGRVARAGRGRSAFYLDLSPDWRGGVSVHIPTGALRDFRSAGVDPLALQDRLIRARGTLSWSYGAPVLTLDHPEALERLSDSRRTKAKP